EIREVDGDKDIIVVIPTADFDGKYAKNCREEIFNGLHIVFVVSGKNNFYFNYAHNCNVGIKKALEYNPKWIVISNDDMYKINEITVLKDSLNSLNETKTSIVFINKGLFHEYPARIAQPRFFRDLLFFTLGKLRRKQLIFEKKYHVNLFLSNDRGFQKLFFKGTIKVVGIGNFGIFSSLYLKRIQGNLFDETFINGGEDLYLSLNIKLRKETSSTIKYSIGDFINTSLGINTPSGIRHLKGTPRRLRDIANMAYFNYKIKLEYPFLFEREG
ncbi:MAG: hypothetical protein ACP5OE_09305, partial [Thermodesulfobium sp.]